MNITYRKATPDEVFKIYQHYVRVVDSMLENGINQWDESYPNAAVIAADISEGDLIVGESDGKLILTYVVNKLCEEEEYALCKWEYPDEPFIALHRIAINPEYQGQGVGSEAFAFLEEKAKEKGIKTIRLDTFCENTAGVSFYNKLGFKIVGFARWKKGRFQIMEKVL